MELGISALSPTVGLSGLPDPMGDATAALEARRRQQVTDAGYDPDKGLYDRYSDMLGFLGPTIAARSRAAADAMRRGDMATYQKIATDLSMDFGSFLGSIKPIRAYHGSPYDFDKFSMDKIGSGEGAQAYGHGLYFAENEGVARSYRDTLRAPGVELFVDGNNLGRLPNTHISNDPAVVAAYERLIPADVDGWIKSGILRDIASLDAPGATVNLSAAKAATIAKMNRELAGRPRMMESVLRDVDKAYASIAGNVEFRSPGRMYEVNIHADPERFLDWDKPIQQQSEAVRKHLPSVLDPHGWSSDPVGRWAKDHSDGGELYRGLSQKRLAEARTGGATTSGNTYADIASDLREAGIPGIKYLDQGSRAAGDGSRNYVVFDDKLIEILRKYGIMAPMAGAGIGSLYLDGEEGGM